jgi:hypothetical protein
MEAKGSLLCSQEHTTEPDASSPHPPNLFFFIKINSNVTIPSTLGIKVVSSLQVFQPKC